MQGNHLAPFRNLQIAAYLCIVVICSLIPRRGSYDAKPVDHQRAYNHFYPIRARFARLRP